MCVLFCFVLALIKRAVIWTRKPRNLRGLWLPGETYLTSVASFFCVFPHHFTSVSFLVLWQLSSLLCVCFQSRKYYFLSEEPEEKEDLSQHCRDLEHQVGSLSGVGEAFLLPEAKELLVNPSVLFNSIGPRIQQKTRRLGGASFYCSAESVHILLIMVSVNIWTFSSLATELLVWYLR